MFKIDFFIFYQQHLFVGLTCLIISIIVTYLIIRKQIYTIYDPIFFFFLLSSSGYSVVLLLWYYSKISNYYFLMFLITQGLFFLGWGVFKKRKLLRDQYMFNDIMGNIIYYISCCIFVSLQLIVYKIMGLPIYMDSRLNAFSGGGGIGVFERFLYVSSIISFSVAFYRIAIEKNKSIIKHSFDFLIISFFIFTKVVSGSKAGLLDCVFIAALVIIFCRKIRGTEILEKETNKILLIFILLSIPVGVSVFLFQIKAVIDSDIIYRFLFRFVNTGDIFYLSWVGNIIDKIPSHSGLEALFSDFLGTFRIIPRVELPQNLGVAVFLMHTSTDNIMGPNSRFNVFGLHYFGTIGAMIYSLFLGLLLGFIRNNLLYRLKTNLSNLIFFVLIAYSATFIEQDFNSMALKYFLNIFIYYCSIGSICLIISRCCRK